MDSQPNNEGSALPSQIALYIHVPFCKTRCPYCDFNTYAGIETLIPGYTDALATEIRCWGALLGTPRVNTIFFGGGTPSYVPGQAVGSILEATRSAFRVAPGAEVTLEANPGDLSADSVASLLQLGINRLSIGVQSFDDSLLKVLGRRHSSREAMEAYHLARRAGFVKSSQNAIPGEFRGGEAPPDGGLGVSPRYFSSPLTLGKGEGDNGGEGTGDKFTNISLDLMYGIPHQSMEQWRDTLSEALSLSPEHLSLYCLTLEEGTHMEQQVRLGELPQPDPDLAADMYLLAEEILGQAGYRHYEISNWARQGKESRHNLTYWRNQPYLGVGAGAHSYLGRWRFHNVDLPQEYVRRLGDAATPVASLDALSAEALDRVPTVEGVEVIEQRMEMAETMMLGLRLEEGVRLEGFAARFGRSLLSVYGEEIQELTSVGLLEQRDGVLRLTGRGRLLGNEVFARFFGE
ncbi:MAG: coproporphyrinogen III oxidase family protein [Chloroflexi bacterium]|nr:coproporphyrinogen III oxidase family protein [Chloroflexota bacterium]